MTEIGFVTDSSSDIPEEIALRYNIKIVPLYIGVDGNTFRDQLEITPDQVFAALREGKKIITSAPSAGDFQKVFKDLFEKDGVEFIYCITLSSKLSGTFNAANIAKKFFPPDKIAVIDSKSSTISLGFISMQAAEAAAAGKSGEFIDKLIKELLENNRFIALLESFEYVFKGGRAVFFGRLVEKAVKLVPILNIGKNGKVRLKKFVKNMENALTEIYRFTVASAKANPSNLIGIFYGSDIKPAEKLKERIINESDIKAEDIILTRITTVISAHTGPGIIGTAISPRKL
ncbi:MAG: DegV family protein [Actinobacteria bacterium]|nr:DegV family protein [Actinomycetota bacterium]